MIQSIKTFYERATGIDLYKKIIETAEAAARKAEDEALKIRDYANYIRSSGRMTDEELNQLGLKGVDALDPKAVLEGSPAYPDCRVPNGSNHPVTGGKVVLTVAHIRHDLRFNGPDDLRHWCQRCHNTHDAPFRAANRKAKFSRTREVTNRLLKREIETKKQKTGQVLLFTNVAHDAKT